jgi:NCAIR mutase (PurE)-related protein
MPRDKKAEFMMAHPPVFAHSSHPMDAEDWLRTVERELHTAQCNDREKVMYGPYLLRGAAQSWWESYLATHADPEAITWEEFRDNLCRYHVPEGLMIVRKEEFLALKQGPCQLVSTGTSSCSCHAMHPRMLIQMLRGSTVFERFG